jgi:Protein of unknown function (DUF429)
MPLSDGPSALSLRCQLMSGWSPGWASLIALNSASAELTMQLEAGLEAGSADKLGIAAMRCALLQERFAREVWAGERQPRDGSGRLVETYPAATLQVLGLPFRRYKGDGESRSEVRQKIVEGLTRLVDLDDAQAACLADDNVLDAVVAAYVTWLEHEKLTVWPSDEHQDFGLVEGWIHLPCEGH